MPRSLADGLVCRGSCRSWIQAEWELRHKATIAARCPLRNWLNPAEDLAVDYGVPSIGMGGPAPPSFGDLA
jgi:hypothetical protein